MDRIIVSASIGFLLGFAVSIFWIAYFRFAYKEQEKEMLAYKRTIRTLAEMASVSNIEFGKLSNFLRVSYPHALLEFYKEMREDE